MGSSKRLLQQSIRLLKSLVQVKMKLLHLIPALAYVNAEVDLDGFLTNLLATFKYPTYGKQYVAAFSEYGCHCKKFSGATENVGGEPIDALDTQCRDVLAGVVPEATLLQELDDGKYFDGVLYDFYEYSFVTTNSVCTGDETADPIDMANADIIDVIGKEHGSELASNLSNHGCHCKKFATTFDQDNVGGAPVDALDTLCRDYFSARSCMKAIDGTCQNDDSKPYEKNFADECSSYALGSCGAGICQNNKDFLVVVGTFVDHTFELNSQCYAQDSAPKSHCCGHYPNLDKYSEDDSICVNGQIQPKPVDPIGYIGCFKDRGEKQYGQPGRVFPARAPDFHELNIEDAHQYCIKQCTALGDFTYYGLEYSRERFCGYGTYRKDTDQGYDKYGKLSENQCNRKCNDNKTANGIATYNNNMCGGKWAIGIYRFR